MSVTQYATGRPAPSERRRSRRIRIRLETAVPVTVRGDNGLQWGLARNVSEGGMLVEVKEPPPIGSRLEIKLFGVKGSLDAPDAALLRGEVRHHVSWNCADGPRVAAIGVRFSEPHEEVEAMFVVSRPGPTS